MTQGKDEYTNPYKCLYISRQPNVSLVKAGMTVICHLNTIQL